VLVSLEGVQGCGKTTAAIALAYDEHKRIGRKVISNQPLQFEHQKFSIEWFLEHISDNELEDCILVLDEMYQIADSRSSGTKLNKLFSYFVVQTRKRGVDMYVCTHHLDHIDLRLRRAVDIRGSCRYHAEKPCKKCRCRHCGGSGNIGDSPCKVCAGVGGTGEVHGKPCDRCLGYGELGTVMVRFLDRRLRRRYSLEIEATRYWHLFNTKERIPIQARILQGIDTVEV